jgi:hypothetical protein
MKRKIKGIFNAQAHFDRGLRTADGGFAAFAK